MLKSPSLLCVFGVVATIGNAEQILMLFRGHYVNAAYNDSTVGITAL